MLFGTSNAHTSARKIPVDKCKLEAVVSMPSGVFKPYAGVSTAVLVFQKGGTTDNVWFYDMEADGFSLDDKRQKVAENDIPDIIAKWKSRGNFGLRPPAFLGLPRRAGNSDFGLKKLAAEPKGEYKADKENHIPGSSIRTSKCFFVPADEIRANKYDLSISRYKEIEHKEIEYEKPGVIIQKVMRLEKEISKDIDEIRTML